MPENELPPVRCPVEGCGALMSLLASHAVVCSANLGHGTMPYLHDKKDRAAWRSRQRESEKAWEVARLPKATRSTYREARSGAPGGYFYRIVDKQELWQKGGGEGEVEANYEGKKWTFRPVSNEVEAELHELLKVLPKPNDKGPADENENGDSA